LKFVSQQGQDVTGSVAGNAILLKPHFLDINIIQFRPQKISYHVSVTLSCDGHCISFIVLKKVRSNYPSTPESTVTRPGDF